MKLYTIFITIATLIAMRHRASAMQSTKRHVMYWDTFITPSLKSSNLSVSVRIGEFMDILCPQTNLGITEIDTPPVKFNLYNVTEEGYNTCNPEGGRLIFACNKPDQENKLTIKFQTISPSPFGFRFQPCRDYYIIAAPAKEDLEKTDSRRKHTCSKTSTRVRIQVGCRGFRKPHTPKFTPTTTTPKTSKTLIDRILINKEKIIDSEFDTFEKPSQPVVVPGIETIQPEKKIDVGAEAQRNPKDNSSSVTRTNQLFVLLMAILSSLCFHHLSASSS